MTRTPSRRDVLGLLAGGLAAGAAANASDGSLPIFDAHIHYSHDAWELVPPKQAAAILRQAGLRGALVSSSDDEGTQKLLAEAPDIVVPELRPYRTRADTSGWVREEAIVRYLEQRLARFRYAGIGEFHLYGEDADLPVPRRLVALAREAGALLHAHSDADAVARLFKQWPQARVLWAHSGFERPEKVRELLRRQPLLWCDLAFRSDHASGGRIDPAWREAFDEFPGRFMVGTDTFTPERWHYIVPHATWSRGWLAELPRPQAEALAWRNAEAMLGRPGKGMNRNLVGSLLAAPALSLATATAQVADCGATIDARSRQRIDSATHALVFAPLPAPWRSARHFALDIEVCPKAGASMPAALKVDADMPAHRHGMNYAPSVRLLAPGRYRADGLLLHMPGRWRIRFDLSADGRLEHLTREVDVP